MKTIYPFLFLATLTVLTACNDDPLPGGVVLEMKAVTTPNAVNGRQSASGLEFTKIMVGLTKLEFETEEENEEEDNRGEEDFQEEVEFKGPFKVDLISGTSAPEFGQALTDPGIYDEIEFKFGAVLDGGKTIDIAFTFEGKEYEVSSKAEKLEFEIEQPNGLKIDENLLTTILVLIDMNVLFENINLAGAVADNDGIIRINEESNASILEALLASFEDSCDGGRDDDKDDRIDGKEDDDDSDDD